MPGIRDVTPRTHPREILQFILHFLRHPIREIARLPDWSWPVLLVVTIVISMISGVIAGFIPPNPYRIAAGLVLSPIVGLVLNAVTSVFFYYYFQVFEEKTVSLRKIYTLNLFAGIPFYIFQTAADLIWIITPIAFAFTALIMVVGLVENFQMEKKRAVRLVGVMLGLVILVWAWNRVDLNRFERAGSTSQSASE